MDRRMHRVPVGIYWEALCAIVGILAAIVCHWEVLGGTGSVCWGVSWGTNREILGSIGDIGRLWGWQLGRHWE